MRAETISVPRLTGALSFNDYDGDRDRDRDHDHDHEDDHDDNCGTESSDLL